MLAKMMNKQEYLLNQLEQKIASFRDDSKQHKSLYRNLRYLVFGLSAISTVLAGVALNYPELNSSLTLSILFVSTLAGVVTSVEGLRKPAELWIHERTTYFALMDLKREVEFKLDDNSFSDAIDEYFYRMQEILGASGEKWNRNIAGVPQKQVPQPVITTNAN
jgi:hypothetical protein